jgi:lipopolysaccharide export system permease protein
MNLNPDILMAARRKVSWRMFRYVLGEFIVAILLCGGGFMVMFVIADLLDDLKDLLEAEASLGQTIHYFSLQIPEHLVHAMPMAMLLGTMFCVGRLARHNELTAMWASGCSLRQCSMPIWGLALVLTMAHFVLAQFISPNFRTRSAAILEGLEDPYNQREKKEVSYLAYHNRSSQRDWFFEDFQPEGTSTRITVTQYRPDNTISWELRAKTGSYADGHWSFADLVFTAFDQEGYLPVQSETYPKRQMDDLTEDPRSFTLLFNLRPGAEIQLAELHELISNRWHALSPTTRVVLKTYYYHYLFGSLACIIAVLVGIPMAVTHERGTALRNFLMSIVLMVAYYLTAQGFLILGKGAIVPPFIAGALPQIMFIGWGLFLMRHKA